MAENFKHLYEQTKKMLTMYQEELVPGFRKKIEELEKNQIKVRCKDCASGKGATHKVCPLYKQGLMKDNDFCSYGERK